MAKALLASMVAAVVAFGPQFHGCRDAMTALTHLTYYPHKDMRTTVAPVPQQVVLLAPDSASVPVTGRPDHLDEQRLIADRIGATAALRNPVPASAASVQGGEREFRRLCVPCHGKSMAGDGAVARSFIPPPDLLSEAIRGRSDGYIYSYVRYGGAVMPRYGHLIGAASIWDVVNYIRHMQRTSPR
jgi:mono/diheme cytochrome c family protein